MDAVQMRDLMEHYGKLNTRLAAIKVICSLKIQKQ